MLKKRTGFYSISVVAKMLDVHQQTIRLYEKEGFIAPQRSMGNTRQFTEEDVTQLEKIIHLTHTLGINLAGVEMILKLQKKVTKLQTEMNKLFENTKSTLENEVESISQEAQKNAEELFSIKKTQRAATAALPKIIEETNKSEAGINKKLKEE